MPENPDEPTDRAPDGPTAPAPEPALASHEHPLARGALLACAAAIPLGLLMLPQLLALALGGVSLARERTHASRRAATTAIAGALALTALWGVGGALLLRALLPG